MKKLGKILFTIIMIMLVSAVTSCTQKTCPTYASNLEVNLNQV